MPPKTAAVNMPNLAKNKKVKFSATMPQFQDQSQHSSQSQSNKSSFQRQDSNISEEIEGPGTSESSEMKNQGQQVSVKSQQQSGRQNSNQSESQENSSSKSDQNNSMSPTNPEPPKMAKSKMMIQQTHSNQIKVSNVSYVSQQQQEQQIPQQQVQTDDFDSNDPKNIVVQEIGGQQAKQESFDLNKKEEQSRHGKVQKIIQQKEEKLQQNKEFKKDQKDLNQLPQQISNQKLKQKPSDDKLLQQTKQRKKKKQKKDKKSKTKTKLQNLPENDNIQQRLQKMDIQDQAQPQFPIINQEETSNNLQQPKEQQEQEQSTNPFYEYIHPYLMLVGSNVIESYMGKKPSYRANEASQWASQLSSKVLLKAYFNDIDEPDNIEEEKNKTIKNSIIQSKIQQNKSYRKLQVELDQLAKSQSFSQIPLSKIYFLIKKFKIIASCIILEKKSKAQVALNISTSCYWNKEKDGQINFSYEGKNCFVMLTLYGVENTRAQTDQDDETQAKGQRYR